MSNIVPVSDVERMARAIAASGLFGMKSPDQAMALMLVAQAEGMHPAIAARDFHVIQGRPALKADAMLARFQAAGGRVRWSAYTNDRVAGVFSHPAGGEVEVEWTIAQAKAAGLTGKDVWRQYPRAMLRARVVSEGIRTVFPGVAVGVYTPEEIGDMPAGATSPTGPREVDMGRVEAVAPDVPDELLDAAEAAAAGGFKSYATWFNGRPLEDRELIGVERHAAFREAALEVTRQQTAATTVDA